MMLTHKEMFVLLALQQHSSYPLDTIVVQKLVRTGHIITRNNIKEVSAKGKSLIKRMQEVTDDSLLRATD